jgi:CubicO group peptidase (beta-lactamase class C family)
MQKTVLQPSYSTLLATILHHCGASLFLTLLMVPTSIQAQSVSQTNNQKPVTVAQAVKQPKVAEDSVRTALPELEKIVNDLLKKTGVPGLAIAIVYKDRVVYLKGFGVREAGKSVPVDPDTVFQLASVSKPIASTVVAGVVGDGLVKWDDPIIKHMPDFQMDSPYVTSQVTIQDMFSHRSGLPDHAGDDLEDLGFDRATILQRLRYLPIRDRFRSVYNYTNFGLTAAAEAVAKATGKSWETLAHDRLYRPLGMNHTSSRYVDFEKAENRALGHVPVNGKWVAKYKREPDAESPAGGVSSTVRDLAQWMRLQLENGMFEGRQIISAKALGETHIPYMLRRNPENPAINRGEFYGLGWNVSYTSDGLVLLGHSGAFNLGAATAVYMLPGERLGIVVLTNARPIGVPESIALSFLDLARFGKTQNYFELFQPLLAEMDRPNYGTLVDYAKPPAKRFPALPPSTYIGSYRNDYFGEIAIAAREGKLVLVQGARKQAFPLQHYDRDVFTYQPEGENAFGLSGVTFTIGANGKASTVVIENLNVDQKGEFKRELP